MKSKSRSTENDGSTAIQAFIDASHKRLRDTSPKDVVLSLPMQIKRILVQKISVEDLFDIYMAVIKKRRRVVMMH
jgi:hypothetical protein